MRIEKRTMGWIQKPSAYQHAQQQAAKRRAQAQAYLDQQAQLSATIFSVKDDAAARFTELVMRSTIERITREGQQKLDKAMPTDLLDKLKTDISA